MSRNSRAEARREKKGFVFVPLSYVEDFDTTQSTASMRTEWQIIQRLKQIRGYKSYESEKFINKNTSLPTLREAEKEIITERIRRDRPEKSWREIAESLGISRQTLSRKREKYDLP